MNRPVSHTSSRARSDTLVFWLFVTPNLIVFGAFTFWPVLYSLWLSVHDDMAVRGEAAFVALDHFARLFSDAAFWKVLLNTFVYAGAVVVIAQTLALLIALALNRPMPGQTLWRTMVFTPQVTTTAAAALVWVVLLQPDIGPLSRVYGAMGVEGPRLLGTSGGALWALVIAGAWKEISFATIFFVAGLQAMPKDVFEAALIDGAGPLRRLRSITVPLLSPVIFFLAVTGFVAAAKTFDLVALMTQGGPVYPDSSLVVYHLYKLAFRDAMIGYASAFAVVVFVILTILLAVQLRLARRFVHYDG